MADLSGTELVHANLIRADLMGANLTDANMTSADLRGAYLSGADLTGANLSGADLEGATLTGADLTGLSLGGIFGNPAALDEGVVIANGYLVGSYVDLTGADLTGADLSSADLSSVSSGGITGSPKLPASYGMVGGYIVDIAAPTAPVAELIAGDNTLTASEVEGFSGISGTAEAGATIALSGGGLTPHGPLSAVADVTTGLWNFSAAELGFADHMNTGMDGEVFEEQHMDMDDGTYTLSITATDAAGNTSAASIVEFTVALKNANSDGSSSSDTGESEYNSHDLAGTVVSRGGGILSDLAITADMSNPSSHMPNSSSDLTATSSNTGTFAMEVDNAASVSLLADMIHTNASPTKAITPQDALEALRLFVGLTTIGGSKTALDFMAADFNKNGKVTPQDALDILKYSVGLRELDTDWMFFDSAGDYSGITKGDVSFAEGVSIADMSADASVGLTGILLGDVNDTYTSYLDSSGTVV